ncbi:MAG: alginate lyase family protein [Acidobacteriota bacterium]
MPLTGAPYTCPAVVHLSRDLKTDGFYSDGRSSVIDPAKWKAYAASSGPYKELGAHVVAAADAYRQTGSRAAAQCALTLMVSAARDGVFTGNMSSRQAYYVQGWVLGAVAISYLKVRDSGLVTREDRKLLLPWFKTVTQQTISFYEKGKAKNNHLYWAGVQAMAVAVATGDPKLFDWAVAAYRTGVAQIQPDGSMPLEMRRGQRALHYHLYALAPLVYIAEFGEENGLHLYAANDHALSKLVQLSIGGLRDNRYFVKATGIAQDTPHGKPAAEQISWAEIWESRFPDPSVAKLLSEASSMSYMYLGGLPPGIHHFASGGQ